MNKREKIARRPRRRPLGQRIAQGLKELRDVLRRREPLEQHFRVDYIDIPDPPRFTANDVKRLRRRLGVTQRLLAKLLGVSPELVEHWEQGIRTPKPMACRLLNEIAHDPEEFIRRIPKSRQARAA